MGDGSDQQLRQACLLAAGVICVVGLVLLAWVLGGDARSWSHTKPLLVAIVFALFSLPAMAGVYLAREWPRLALVGIATTLLAIAAFVSVVAAYWPGGVLVGGDDGWKIAGILTLLSIGSGQVSLLFGLARDDDSDVVRLVRLVVVVPIALLVGLAISEISSPGPDVSAKVFESLALLYLVGMAVVPLLQRGTRID